LSTIFTHAVIPLTVGLGIGRPTVTPKLIAAGCLFAVVPDIDVIGFELGVSYYSPFGHRGFTHSIVFAILWGLVATSCYRQLGCRPLTAFLFLTFSMMSHGILDALTYGGAGIGFSWPLSPDRHFFSWRPLPVSPIGIDRFFNRWGMYVLKTEIIRVWMPLFACLLVLLIIRYSKARK
jgi:inner membrane protein